MKKYGKKWKGLQVYQFKVQESCYFNDEMQGKMDTSIVFHIDMESYCFHSAIASFLLLASSSASLSFSHPSSLLGVHPLDEKYYSSQSIKCKDGSKSFSRDRLNDNFCDCSDGTDEPDSFDGVGWVAQLVELVELRVTGVGGPGVSVSVRVASGVRVSVGAS
ncbi:hypothetical protein TSUD_135060 [Trifolium subterraneum]|uniref:Glucosidase II beta subunit N-terminal domain-containing protein n=1 Tax=Trifolium subterraneum TaxID=3900 RepID=A0A2Z6LUS3_TRISU|nr:hypothetical protein TSUD_135060 [Trifolium subterraneum]